MLIINIASLLIVGGIAAAFLVAQDRRDKRERAERAELLQRIQAPQAAVAEHHRAVEPAVQTNDGLPMTDAEMVELQGGQPVGVDQERERLIAWMEAVENGTTQIQDGVIQ